MQLGAHAPARGVAGLALALAALTGCASESSSFGWTDDENDDLASVTLPPGGSGGWTFELLATGDGAGPVTLAASSDAPAIVASASVTPTSVTLEDGVEASITLMVTVAAGATPGQTTYVSVDAMPASRGNTYTRTLRVSVQ